MVWHLKLREGGITERAIWGGGLAVEEAVSARAGTMNLRVFLYFVFLCFSCLTNILVVYCIQADC